MIVIEFIDTADYAFSPADRQLVQKGVNAAEASVRILLPQLQNSIKMTVKTGSKIIPTTGEMGTAVGQGHVVWTVDPSRPEGFLGIAKAHLRPMLFHELNHVVRKQEQTRAALLQRTILDFAASEGLATSFERSEGGRLGPWGQYPLEVQSWVDELIALPPDASFHHWMFRHPDGRRWIGYRAGTYVIDQVVERSSLSPAELVQMPTKQLFELAGYKI